jgi:hypothetical protein
MNFGYSFNELQIASEHLIVMVSKVNLCYQNFNMRSSTIYTLVADSEGNLLVIFSYFGL